MARVRMPANIEADDTILAGLTVRQLLIIGVPGIGVWAGLSQLHPHVPLPVLISIGVPVMGVAVALALVRRDGLSLDQLSVAALRFLRAPKHRASTTQPHAPVPAWISAQPTSLPAPLDLPLTAISDEGILELGEQGSALVLSCTTVNFALRTEAEQAALVSGFASFLNSLSTAPAQILIRAESVQLDPLVAAVQHTAPSLAHPALEQAAHDHAGFLAELAENRDLLYRQVLLVLREPNSPGTHAAATLRRRAEEASRALAAAGSQAHVMDGPEVAAVLASAASPTTRAGPPVGLAPPGATITGPQPEQTTEENTDGTASH